MAFRSDVENPLLCMHDILFLENLRSLWRVILDYNVFLKNKDILRISKVMEWKSLSSGKRIVIAFILELLRNKH